MVDKPVVAFDITLALRVLAAINFDNEPLLTANEIYNEWADRLLADEFVAT
jgi:hypothetical protein